MTELEYVLENFDAKFALYKGDRIVLHGSRSYAAGIVEKFGREYGFVGIMSDDPLEGETYLGLPVLDMDTADFSAVDMIILTERVKYAEAAYREVHRICEDNKIRLYNMYGLDEIETHLELDQCVGLSEEEWIKITDAYDAVGFEAMDTFFFPPITESILTPRPKYENLYAHLKKQNKEIFFSLRKSYPEEPQRKSLGMLQAGGPDHNHILKRDGEDLSFRKLKDMLPGKKILYIGSGLVNECILPRCYGIDTYRNISLFYDCFAPVAPDDLECSDFDAEFGNRVKAAIDNVDVVSFDIFDTVLQRILLTPADVFVMMEAEGGVPAGFANERAKVESDLKNPDIFEIYRTLGERLRLNSEEIDRIRELEFETEKRVLVSRTAVSDLIGYAGEKGKTVVLTSDMYYPEYLMKELLDHAGVTGYSKIFVSCDFRKNKISGLFDEIKQFAASSAAEAPDGDERHAVRVLHIGDNRMADGDAAVAAGFETVHIPSALETAMSHGWEHCVYKADGFNERALIGLAVAKAFADPFETFEIRALPMRRRLERYADSVVGSLTAGFITWIVEEIRREEYDGVLFLARDGYIPYLVYKYIEKRAGLPAAYYFHSSRKASFHCIADEESQIERAVEIGKQYELDEFGTLEKLYGINKEKMLPRYEDETIFEYIRKHSEERRRTAESAREGYLKYAENLGLKKGGRYLAVDFVSTGTTLIQLRRLPYILKGAFFGTSYEFAAIQNGFSCYLKCENDTLLRNYIELETYYSSPEPSMQSIGKDGKPVFAEEKRSPEEINEFLLVKKRTVAFAEEYFDKLNKGIGIVRSIIPEEIFAADGYHNVQREAYEDWSDKVIKRREYDRLTPDR